MCCVTEFVKNPVERVGHGIETSQKARGEFFLKQVGNREGKPIDEISLGGLKNIRSKNREKRRND